MLKNVHVNDQERQETLLDAYERLVQNALKLWKTFMIWSRSRFKIERSTVRIPLKVVI